MNKTINMNCAGVIVFISKNSSLKVILAKTSHGHWSFPKGKKEKFESDILAALRELSEETGLTENDIEIAIDNHNNYTNFVDNGTIYFMARTQSEHVPKFNQEELEEVKWLEIKKINRMTNFEFKPSRTEILKNAIFAFNTTKTFIKVNDVIKKNKELIETRISKLLTWILRHKAIDLGLKIKNDGYILLDDILELRQMKGITVDQIKNVVINNDKQRFILMEDKEVLYIRACQGHSQALGKLIHDEKLLKKITKPYDICFHGTYKKFAQSIKKKGLKAMGRKHIHLINSFTAKSGVRPNVNAFIHIDMESAMNDGIEFFESENGVILTKGKDGILDPKYINKVEFK